MAVKLLAVDLDGTLLRDDRTPHPASARALQDAVAAGITVVLASGRAIGTIRPFGREIGIVGPIVSCNGAYVEDPDGSELSHACLSEGFRDELVAYAESNGVHVNLYSRGDIYLSSDGQWAKRYLSRVKGIEPRFVGYPGLRQVATTKLLMADHPEAILRHHEAFLPRVPAGLTHITVSEREYVEFLPPDVHKGRGVQRVAEWLGIPAEQVAAIGDYLNDLEMLSWVGHSAAVANAHPTVLETAKAVVSSNEDGGVAEFVTHILKL